MHPSTNVLNSAASSHRRVAGALRLPRLAAASAAFLLGGMFAVGGTAQADTVLTSPQMLAPVLVASAHVQDDAAKDGRRHGKHEDRRMRGPHRQKTPALVIPGVGHVGERTVKALSLDAAQTQQLEAARSAQQELRKAQHESMRAAGTLRTEQLKAGKLDPREALKTQQQAREQARAQHLEVQEKWLVFWDALTPAQQGEVVQQLQKQSEAKARWQEKRQSREQRGERPEPV